jgi:hypothetical protein
MHTNDRSRHRATILGVLALLAIASSAAAWKSTDGEALDDPGRECKRRGGRYLGQRHCAIPIGDPITRCKEAGGVLMDRGVCFRPAQRRR